MKYYTFEVAIQKEPEDEGYMAYSPVLPGCFSNGKSIEEARRNIRQAIQQHIETLRSHRQAMPQAVRILKDAGFSVEDYLRLR